MCIEKIIDFLKDINLDAVLVSSIYNCRYISGFTGDTSYLYISSKRQVLLTDSRYTTWAKSETKNFDVYEINAENPYSDVIAAFLSEDNAASIGFENRQMLYSDVMKFMDKAPNVEFIELDDKLDEFRQIKTADEISKIKCAQEIGDAAFTHILKFLKEGQTEEEIALEIEMYMRKNGASKLSFETIVASGPNSAMPHAAPGNRKIRKGDFVTMDYGCIFDGYCSDMTRTVFIGAPNKRQCEIYDIVLRAQNAALSEICEGKICSEIDKTARDIIADAGFGEYFGHGLGHSLGLFIHEEPRLSPKYNKELKENMVVTVEPGIYIPDFGGVRIEDLVVVTKNGCNNLTSSNKEKIIVEK